MSSATPNFFGAAFLDDPYPFYRRMRAAAPVMRQPGMRGTEWLLTRHADIRAVLGDRHHFVTDAVPQLIERAGARQDGCRRLADNTRDWLFFIDPPEHTRRRSAVARAFSPQAIEALAPRVSDLLRQRLPARRGGVEVDVVRDLGNWLPAMTMLDLLGVREAEVDWIAQTGSAIFSVFEQPVSPERHAALGAQVGELEALIERWLAQPQRYLEPQGLLHHLLSVDGDRDEPPALARRRLLGFVTMLLSVGQDTTKHVLGNGLAALAAAPTAWEALAAEPGLLPAAVEELARYDSPVQVVARVAAADTSVGGQAVRSGERLYLFLGAGLHDPEVFERPDALEFERPRAGHLHFGAGPHFCLGAPIARVIVRALLQHLLRPGRRPPQSRPEGTQRLRCVHLRGFAALPLRLDLTP